MDNTAFKSFVRFAILDSDSEAAICSVVEEQAQITHQLLTHSREYASIFRAFSRTNGNA